MNLELIMQRFDNCHERGDGFTCRCPSHKDNGPSLSVREKDGKILIHCFAGCKTSEVLAAVGLRFGDLFSTPADKTRMPMALRADLSHAKTLVYMAACHEGPLDPRDLADVRKAKVLIARWDGRKA